MGLAKFSPWQDTQAPFFSSSATWGLGSREAFAGALDVLAHTLDGVAGGQAYHHGKGGHRCCDFLEHLHLLG